MKRENANVRKKANPKYKKAVYKEHKPKRYYCPVCQNVRDKAQFAKVMVEGVSMCRECAEKQGSVPELAPVAENRWIYVVYAAVGAAIFAIGGVIYSVL